MTTKEQGKKTRQRILNAIVSYMMAYNYPPTVREICDLTGIKSTSTINRHLDIMCDCGVISRELDQSRTINVMGIRYIDERGPQ